MRESKVFSNLTYLNCENNQALTLDVSSLIHLTYLNCARNQITQLDVSNLSQLYTLDCSLNHIINLDVSNLIHLHNLEASQLGVTYGTLVSLNASGCSSLYSLSVYGNRLTTF